MDVALLYFDDCPNWRETGDLLDELTAELAFTWLAVQVNTPEAAQLLGFHGSPSIHIDGVDPFADPDMPVGLSCRIYPTPAGLSGTPDRSQLRDALVKGGAASR